jgi:hypothetical protein
MQLHVDLLTQRLTKKGKARSQAVEGVEAMWKKKLGRLYLTMATGKFQRDRKLALSKGKGWMHQMLSG